MNSWIRWMDKQIDGKYIDGIGYTDRWIYGQIDRIIKGQITIFNSNDTINNLL